MLGMNGYVKNGYVKLLVLRVGTYETKILQEYNLSDRNEVQSKMGRYKDDEQVIGVTIHMG